MEAAARDVKGFQRFEVLRLTNGRLEHPEQQRAMEANGRLQRSNNKMLVAGSSRWVEVAAKDFKRFYRI